MGRGPGFVNPPSLPNIPLPLTYTSFSELPPLPSLGLSWAYTDRPPTTYNKFNTNQPSENQERQTAICCRMCFSMLACLCMYVQA